MLDAERLINLRKRRKLKQADVAVALNIERTTYVKYEKSGIQPSSDMITKLANFFDTSTDYLLGNTDDPTPPNVRLGELSLEEVIRNRTDLSDEAKEIVLTQLKLAKMLDGARARNLEEVSMELRPSYS